MDPHNPIIAQTYIKPVPAWMLALYCLGFVALVGIALWGTTVALFSLEPVSVAQVKK